LHCIALRDLLLISDLLSVYSVRTDSEIPTGESDVR
jgi:hypothetical protein